MRYRLRATRHLAFLSLAIVFAACGGTDVPPPATSTSPAASGSTPPEQSAVPTTPQADESSVPTLTAAPSPEGELYVNEAQGWSVTVPAGWEVVGTGESAAFVKDGLIAEVLVSPSSGLTLQELETQKVEFLSNWQGMVDIESELVRLPAGEAVWVTLESSVPDVVGQTTFTMYAIEEGDTQFVISVRALDDRERVLAAAEALAESFAILG